MERYSKNNACPKCSYGPSPRLPITTTYHFNRCQLVPDDDIVEHFDRQCPRCSYLWAEQTLSTPRNWLERHVVVTTELAFALGGVAGGVVFFLTEGSL